MMKTAGHGATLALAGLLLNVGSAQRQNEGPGYLGRPPRPATLAFAS